MPDPVTNLPTAAEHRDQALEYVEVANVHFNGGDFASADIVLRMASIHSALAQSAAQDALIQIQTGMVQFLEQSQVAPPPPAQKFHWEAIRAATDKPKAGEHIRKKADKRAAIWRIQEVIPGGKLGPELRVVSTNIERTKIVSAKWYEIVVAVEDE